MSDLITTTRATVKRGWTEFEPKVITGLLSGSTGAALIPLLASVGIHVDDTWRNFIIVGCYFLGSYLTPSSGMVVTTKSTNGDEVVTKTTGHTVTTTGAIPIQVVPESEPIPEPRQYGHILNNLPSARPNSDDQATAILPPPTNGF